MPLDYASYSEKRSLLLESKLSLKENVEYFIAQANAKADLNAFVNVYEEEAIQRAEEINSKLKNGTAGRLAGMVIAIKDVLSHKGHSNTCSSKILQGFTALYTATAVQRLLDEDAIIIGRTNCDEFAMGSSNENSFYGPVKNPIDTTRVPGGSSGGSAVAVAAGLCDAALGTDTGGSIRQPASFTGIFGLKPTYGRVSRYGLTAFASSFDTIGPFTQSAEDSALLLSVMAGNDEKDSTCSETPVANYFAGITEPKPLKIGLPKEYFGEGLNPEVKEKIDAAIENLKSKGCEIYSVSLPHTEFSIATYYILTTAEASSNLARFDGVKYGYRSGKAGSLTEMYTATRSEGFGKEVKRRIMLGTYVLSSGYYDAYYKKAQKVRRIIQQDFFKCFEQVDVLLTPTSPFTAFAIGEKSDNPLEMYLSDIYTTSANLAGVPGISVPVGTDAAGLPIGVQFIANQFNEEKLFNAARLLA